MSPSLHGCTKSEVDKKSEMGLGGTKVNPPPPPINSPIAKHAPATPPKASTVPVDCVVVLDDADAKTSPAPTLRDVEETQLPEDASVPSATEPGVSNAKGDSTPPANQTDPKALGGQPTLGEHTIKPPVSKTSVPPVSETGVPPKPNNANGQGSVETPSQQTVVEKTACPLDKKDDTEGVSKTVTPPAKPTDAEVAAREEKLAAELEKLDVLELEKRLDEARRHPLLPEYYRDVLEVSMDDCLFGEGDEIGELVSFNSYVIIREGENAIPTPVPSPPVPATGKAAVAKAPEAPVAKAPVAPPTKQPPPTPPQNPQVAKVTFQPNPPEAVPAKNSVSPALDVRVVGNVLQLQLHYIDSHM